MYLQHRRKSFRGGASNGLLNSLVSYWTLDSTTNDAHGSNNGTGTNLTYDTTNQKLGTAAGDFNGTNSYVTISHDTSFATTAMSFSLWVKLEGVGGTEYILFKDQSGPNAGDIGLYLNNNSFRLDLQSNSATYPLTTGTVSNGNWYHLVFTSDGSTDHRLYMNNTEEDTETASRSISDNSLTLYLGGWTTTLPYDGLIDGVGRWSRELTTDDISNLYNSGDGLPYGDFTS